MREDDDDIEWDVPEPEPAKPEKPAKAAAEADAPETEIPEVKAPEAETPELELPEAEASAAEAFDSEAEAATLEVLAAGEEEPEMAAAEPAGEDEVYEEPPAELPALATTAEADLPEAAATTPLDELTMELEAEPAAEPEADVAEEPAEPEAEPALAPETELEEEPDEEPAEPEAKPAGFSRFELLEILLSRRTKLHFMVLIVMLALFAFLSKSSADWAVKLLYLLGYGIPLGYLLTGLLTRFEAIRELSRSDHPTSLLLPLGLGLLVAAVLWYGLDQSDQRERLEKGLALGLVGIFLVWQFAQAWWMRVPFREFALRRVGDQKLVGESNLGRTLNLLAPLLWAAVGFGFFALLASQIEDFKPDFDSIIFKVKWFGAMIGLGVLLAWGIHRLQREHATEREVSTFSGYFAVGYWAFLAYTAGMLLYSLTRDPSFVFDLLLMFITILVAIYSLSVQALKAEGLINRHNVIFFAIAFTVAYGASNFFLVSGAGIGIEPRTLGRVSKFFVLLSGLVVLLLVNHEFLKQRGLVRGGLIHNLKRPMAAREPALEAETAQEEETE